MLTSVKAVNDLKLFIMSNLFKQVKKKALFSIFFMKKGSNFGKNGLKF